MKCLLDSWTGIAKYMLFAGPCFYGAFSLFLRPDGNIVEGFGFGLMGASLLVLGATIIAIPVARLIAEPAGNLFLPSSRWKYPLPIYSRPRAFRARKNYGKAFEAFNELSREYPQELSPYLEMLEIAVKNLGNTEVGQDVYNRGVKNLRNSKHRKRLTRLHDELLGAASQSLNS